MASTRPPLDGTFFEVMQDRGIAFTPSLRDYFRRLTRSSPKPETVRQLRMEEFFKDLYFDFLESPTDPLLHQAYIDLVETYVQVLRETTNWLCEDTRDGAPIGRLIADAADASDEVTVVTFNHDLVIENEIFRRRRLVGRWCLDHGYGSLGQAMTPVFSSGDARFLVHSQAACDHDRPIKVLKLHGSLNWLVRLNGKRPTARTLSGQSGPKRIQLVTSRLVPREPRFRRTAPGSGRVVWNMWPVLIPPVYAKQALRQTIRQTWDDAQAALQRAERVVFFGYSLPAIDIDAEKLFERALAQNPTLRWIDVIDPSPSAAARYAALGPDLPVHWYPSLDQFRTIGSF